MPRIEYFDGISVQWPYSSLIVQGKKVIETRTYPIADRYLNKTLLLIETPGRKGKFKSRVVAKIEVIDCFKYVSKQDFYKDFKKHLVDEKSEWKWSNDRPKWGWVIRIISSVNNTDPGKRVGIIYTKNIPLSLKN
jgi:hypothetical protein